ncbi:response regulator transcription factor [candidate division KSB1 bacterium]|nr:response regulator transcription factor [candidate division KSB1 bacterium]
MIRVAIVEDEDEIRESLAIIINSAPGFACAGSYPDCESALSRLEDDLPDVILMDIKFRPGKMSGIDGVRKIKARLQDVDIIMLTIYEDNVLIFDSLRAGACGYLLKHTSPAELLASIKEVVAGGAPMSTKIARLVVGSFQNGNDSPQLTSRQKEILQKLREGKSYRTIGEELFISENTVKCHIKKIYELLHVHTQAEAIAKAFEKHLI